MLQALTKNKTIQDLCGLEHTCLIYNSEIEFFHCLIPFVRDGIKNNEKCLIVIDEIKRESVLRNFKFIYREGFIPPKEFSKDGNIVIEKFKNIYLKNGYFSMEETIGFYGSSTKQAIDAGYTGLRAFVEVSCDAKEFIGQEIFLAWEEYADDCLKQSKEQNFKAVCAYDKKYFDSKFLEKMIHAHPVQIDLIGTRL